MKDMFDTTAQVRYGPHAGKGRPYGATLVPRPAPRAEARRAQKARMGK